MLLRERSLAISVNRQNITQKRAATYILNCKKMESRLIRLIILSDRTLIPDCRQACTDFGFMPFCPRYLQK